MRKTKNRTKVFLDAQARHAKFISSLNLNRKLLSIKDDSWYRNTMSNSGVAKTSDVIPANGTKSPDMSKANFSKSNFALVPAYNKGPIQPMTKNDMKSGAGRKL